MNSFLTEKGYDIASILRSSARSLRKQGVFSYDLVFEAREVDALKRKFMEKHTATSPLLESNFVVQNEKGTNATTQ